jgi:alpha-tubulin suppressor-like RCC1 family protein
VRRTSLAICLVVLGAACEAADESDAGVDAGVETSDAAADAGMPCASDLECDDAVFCNGEERCAPADPGADADGCVAGAAPCEASCDELGARCLPEGCETFDADGDGLASIACGGLDCDDSDPDRHPGNPERCELPRDHDEDCDPCTVASAADGDLDVDGFTSAACSNTFEGTAPACDATTRIVGSSVVGLDCDDMNDDVRPNQTEACNGLDDNCDGATDEGALLLFYADVDRDFHGDPASIPRMECFAPDGYVENDTDCDDAEQRRNPSREEQCDGLDNDCDTIIDEDADAVAFYADRDGDGHGTGAMPIPGDTCTPPSGYSLASDDCNDSSGAIHPSATELCDGLDNDCSLPVGMTGRVDASEDADGDGHSPIGAACSGGFPIDDCDDACVDCFSGADEYCDGNDNDCDGTVDTTFDQPCAPDSACTENACTSTGGIALGQVHACAIRPDRTVLCWGFNRQGQLGRGTLSTVPPATFPNAAAVLGVTDAREIVAGTLHTCVRTGSGGVQCWGGNDDGQLGDGTSVTRGGAAPVLGISDAIEIAAGGSHTCARHADGAVSCWGRNNFGQLGDGTRVWRLRPVTVVGLTDAVDIAAGVRFTCAVRAGGSVVCWGLNEVGQLGDGTLDLRVEPTPVVGVSDAVEVAAGLTHACARRATGQVVCWGANGGGQLGDGTTTDSPVPVDAAVGPSTALALGAFFTCALTSSEAACWGENFNGELGDGTGESSLVPVSVVSSSDAIGIAAGEQSACMRRSTGAVACWGSNRQGQLGDGSLTTRLAPVAVLGTP